MSRGTWVWDRQNQKVVPKHLYREPNLSRSDLPSPMLIKDGLDDLVNPVDGKRYDSKRKYYKAVRDAGCEIVGNEKVTAAPKPQMADPVQDIKDAIEQIEARD